MNQVCPLEEEWKAIRELRDLLTNLEGLSKPGDLIVLSTLGELSGISIYDISFDGAPETVMIERNPVIYSSGLNLFRRCLERAQGSIPAQSASSLEDAFFTSAFEEGGYEDERSAIFSHLRDIAQTFRSKTLLGEGLTLTAIRRALTTASWIHYHGHAFYARTEALNQCLVLGRLKEGEREVQSRIQPKGLENMRLRLEVEMPLKAPLTDREVELSHHLLQGSSRLTVADVFAMDLSNTNPVVMNIACDSGIQEFSQGDDPLGFVSAFFCAGASSVLGTLWPIRSDLGRLFSKTLYDSMAKQDRGIASTATESQQRFLNLAFAFRDATLAVKKANPEPYFWASFVLQGAPIYISSSKTYSSIATN
jgi:CHAT domain-containing protein